VTWLCLLPWWSLLLPWGNFRMPLFTVLSFL
jgi:hypothetical protein